MGAPWRPARVVSRLSAGALLEDFAARSGFLGRDLENPDRKPPIPEPQANFESRVRIQQVKNRSEEHTSELQSLMRISYAVFCLQKKTNTNNNLPDTTSISVIK